MGPNLLKKGILVEFRKSEHHHWILHIWISLGTRFQLKLAILNFWTKNGLSDQKWKSKHHYWILHIQISLGTKAHFKQTILNFGTKFVQKELFFLENRKGEDHDSILHVQISLGTKIQLKLTILISWQFFEKGISGQKWKNEHRHFKIIHFWWEIPVIKGHFQSTFSVENRKRECHV